MTPMWFLAHTLTALAAVAGAFTLAGVAGGAERRHYLTAPTGTPSPTTFGAPGALALDVSDPQGLATGRWILRVDDQGAGTVTPWQDEAPADAVAVRLGITELSAAYLGRVSLGTLAAAGRVHTTDASIATRIFSWHVAPRLSFWY